MNTSKKLDPVTEMMRKKLEVLFPSIGKGLYVFVYSRKDGEQVWDLENGNTVETNLSHLRNFAEYEMNERIPDSRIGAWGESKQIKWVIFITEALDQNLKKLEESRKVGLEPVRYFFHMVLKKLSKGLIDCMMFEQLKNMDHGVLEHIFSELPKITDLLAECIEKLMKENELPNPFLLTQLSAQFYEKRPVHGGMLFLSENDWEALKKEDPGEKDLEEQRYDIMSLEEVKGEQRKLDIDNIRFLRKLVELNSDQASIVVMKEDREKNRTEEWMAVGLISNQLVENDEKFWVDFKGQLKWSVRKKQAVWFTYRDGSWRLYAEECLKEDYGRIVREQTPDHSEELIQIIELLKKEQHGTSIVFIENTHQELSNEVNRFFGCNRCVKLSAKGIKLREYLNRMRGITAIDGALLADFSGICYAIGVIFDGDMLIEGNVSRGARYNSVANYVQVVKKKYGEVKVMGVIVSEDGGVEVKRPEVYMRH